MVCESNNFDILYQKYQPLIYKSVLKYQKLFKTYGYELDDLMQIGYMVLYKTSFLYQDYNNSLFYTYFLSALNKAIISEIRCNESYKRKTLNESFSYDNIIPNTDLCYIDIIGKNNEENKYNNFVIFKNSLSFISSCIFELYYNGYNLKEISLILDEDKKTIKESIKEIRKQIQVQSYN